MTTSRPNPTAGRLILAARLRKLRIDAGKTPEDAARELMGSTSKISRIETGERAAVARDVRDLGRFYGASEAEIAELQQLAVEARKKGWWADYRALDERAANYVGLEDAASSCHMLENLRWPGPCQTPEVTRAFLSGLRPEGELSPAFVEDQVIVRQKRQERLVEGGLVFHGILDEAMFRRPLGDGVVAGQIVRLLELSDLANVTIQVVPFEAGAYPGLDGTFYLLQFPPASSLTSTVYVEGLLGSYLVEDAVDVDHYEVVFRSVEERNALDPADSRIWLQRFHSSL
jgi:transcriptional regulator with XRE-family HTH domain